MTELDDLTTLDKFLEWHFAQNSRNHPRLTRFGFGTGIIRLENPPLEFNPGQCSAVYSGESHRWAETHYYCTVARGDMFDAGIRLVVTRHYVDRFMGTGHLVEFNVLNDIASFWEFPSEQTRGMTLGNDPRVLSDDSLDWGQNPDSSHSIAWLPSVPI